MWVGDNTWDKSGGCGRKWEKDQCITEEAAWTICAERLIWHEMDIVEMQAGQP